MNLVQRVDVRLPSIISNNMVIQSDINVPIWGRAEPCEVITINISNQKQTTIADANGKWSLKLSPVKSSNVPVNMVIDGENRIAINNILMVGLWTIEYGLVCP